MMEAQFNVWTSQRKPPTQYAVRIAGVIVVLPRGVAPYGLFGCLPAGRA